MLMTEKDGKLINEKYNSLLFNIKECIKNKEMYEPLEIYKLICNMFRSGKFSIDGTIEFSNDFDYITFYNIKNIGAQVMQGICCCRHASSFVFDILKSLDFDVSLYYISIEDNNWRVTNPNQANHMTVLLKDKEFEYILDPINDFILKIEEDNRLSSIDIKSNSNINNDILYDDINEIGSTLKKYYCYKKLGINNVYDY